MHSFVSSLIASLAVVAATGANPLPSSTPGECVALASEWTVTDFGTDSNVGVRSTHFNFTDSLGKSTRCEYGFTNAVDASKFHNCDNPALRFSYVTPNLTIEETVSCTPENGTQIASTGIQLRCEVFGARTNCVSQVANISLYPALTF